MSARQKLMSKEHDEEKPMSLINIFSRKQNSRLLSDTDTALVKRFEHFRGFLLANRSALNGIAELEQLYYAGAPTSKSHITSYLKTLEGSISELLLRLNALGKNRYAMLPERMHNIFSGITSLSTISLPASLALVVPLSSLRAGDEVYAGSKACNLGILRGTLAITVPDGFAVTAGAFIQFIEDNGLRPLLEQELGEVDASDLARGEAACTRIRDAILQAPVPALLAEKILGAYEALEGRTRPGVRVAVRSSAIGEDTAASFAGQYHTELNVTRSGLLDAYRKVLASKYSLRAVMYRLRFGLDDEDTPMCVACIAMVDSTASGVARSRCACQARRTAFSGAMSARLADDSGSLGASGVSGRLACSHLRTSACPRLNCPAASLALRQSMAVSGGEGVVWASAAGEVIARAATRKRHAVRHINLRITVSLLSSKHLCAGFVECFAACQSPII